ncbi:hypothetical protein PTKIN_Ptkin18bG0129000 [Pterospermum kingtungense]
MVYFPPSISLYSFLRELRSISEEGRNEVCILCTQDFTPKRITALLTCGHVFHLDCIEGLRNSGRPECSVCSALIKFKFIASVFITDTAKGEEWDLDLHVVDPANRRVDIHAIRAAAKSGSVFSIRNEQYRGKVNRLPILMLASSEEPKGVDMHADRAAKSSLLCKFCEYAVL